MASGFFFLGQHFQNDKQNSGPSPKRMFSGHCLLGCLSVSQDFNYLKKQAVLKLTSGFAKIQTLSFLLIKHFGRLLVLTDSPLFMPKRTGNDVTDHGFWSVTVQQI